MKLNERVAIITEENISRLSHLYGEMDIDEIEEDSMHPADRHDFIQMYL